MTPSISSLAADWLARFRSEIERLPAQVEGGAAASVHRTMHDAKALAPTFGYALIGEIAARAADRLRHAGEELSRSDRTFMMAVHAALGFALTHEIAGDGGDAGRAILAKLDALGSAA